ncbi:unnamed protein product [Lupinus luteus]|uniref:GATA-type domain-containing protein n=1 Tax=Lupinus luteus TaxID=3873 RepID=A0AAV1WP53_LUPLU
MDFQALRDKSCRDCHTTTTPLWRAGPDGPRSLCNACGLRYRKRTRVLQDLDKGVAKKNRKMNIRRIGSESKLKEEEEEAAILLMALSCGSLCNY